MDIKGRVGETAGKVWHLLNSHGPHTLAQKKLDVPSELLSFAVGWLAREDKVNIIQEKKGFLIQLK
jgi:hypothetical protein